MVIKMKDLIKSQTDIIRKQQMWTEAEDEPQEKQPDPFQKLKIDIPDDPFDKDNVEAFIKFCRGSGGFEIC